MPKLIDQVPNLKVYSDFLHHIEELSCTSREHLDNTGQFNFIYTKLHLANLRKWDLEKERGRKRKTREGVLEKDEGEKENGIYLVIGDKEK